jgi:hypothetical protein
MKLSQIFESYMKRSDPVISGEMDPTTQRVPFKLEPQKPKTKSSIEKTIINFAEKAGVSVDKVWKLRREIMAMKDNRKQNYYAEVNRELKRQLGI